MYRFSPDDLGAVDERRIVDQWYHTLLVLLDRIEPRILDADAICR